MRVILKKRIPNLGQEWDVVTVKNGYARNFLLPQQMAEFATPEKIRKAEKMAADRLKRVQELVANAKETAGKMVGIVLTFTRKAKDGKLFGSITEKDVAEALVSEHKIEITKEMVKMKKHLKTIGDHEVKIHLSDEAEAIITVQVKAE